MTDVPRIPPLPSDQWDPRTAALVESLRIGGEDMHLFSTLARHPRLLKRWSAFGGLLLFGGTLNGRDREVLILRTAANTGADYEWGHHVALAEAAGLSPDEINELARPEPEVRPEDALLVRAADELHELNALTDQTWEALTARFDEQQLIELCMVVGQYHLVAFTLNSLRIQREPGFEGVPR